MGFPPCTEYSMAKTVGVRKIAEANKVVERTLEIIAYLRPTYYVIENPQTGYLKVQTFMQELPYKDVDYCKYGMPYRKRTRLWNNVASWIPRPLCVKDCAQMLENRHRQTAQNRPRPNYTEDVRIPTRELYKIPQQLVDEIEQALTNSIPDTPLPTEDGDETQAGAHAEA